MKMEKLFPQGWLQVRGYMWINYQKVNFITWNDHFLLSFMDQRYQDTLIITFLMATLVSSKLRLP